MINYQDYIGRDASTRFGRPTIKGTRISVYDVMNWLANGMSEADIIADFPELDSNAIRACLAYVANRENRLSIHHEAVI